MGGLGIRNVRTFNIELLAKQVVRIHKKIDLLLSKVMSSKYKGTPIELGFQNRKIRGATWGFKGLCYAIFRCRQGFSKVIGNGCKTIIMEDNWTRRVKLELRDNVSINSMRLEKVKDLMLGDPKVWNRSLIWKIFKMPSTNRILGTYIPQCQGVEDDIVWSRNDTSQASTKEIYAMLMENNAGKIEDHPVKRKFGEKYGPCR